MVPNLDTWFNFLATIPSTASLIPIIAIIKINKVALINSGIVIANIVTVDIATSGNLSLHRAVIIPKIKAIGIPIKIGFNLIETYLYLLINGLM